MNKDETQILFLIGDWTNTQQVFIEAAAQSEISIFPLINEAVVFVFKNSHCGGIIRYC